MAGPYSAGTVFLQVVPSYDGFMQTLQRDAKGIADELNKSLQGEVDKGKGVKPKIDREGTKKDTEAAGKEAAKGFGGAFEKEMQSRLKAVAGNLPKVKVDADVDDATRELSNLGKQIDKLSKTKIGVDMDADQAIREIAALEAELKALSKGRNSIDFHVNTSRALTEVAAMRKSMERTLKDLQVKIDPRIEGAFEKRLKSQIRGALESIPPIKLDADSSPAERKVAALRARLQTLGSKAIGVDVSSSGAVLELAQIRDTLGEIRDDSNVDIQVRGDTAAANAALREIDHLVERLDGQRIRIRADVDNGGAGGGGRNGLTAMFGGGDSAAQATNTANAFRAFNGVLLTAVTLGPALVPILAAIAGGLAAIGPMAVAGGAGLGILVAGFSGISDAVTALGNVQKNAGADALAAAKTQRTAATQVANARRTLSRALEDSAQANEDAQRRVKRAQDDAARSAADAGRRVADAQRDAAEAGEDAARRLADAQRNAAEANQAAAQRVEDAQNQQTEAIQRAAEASARAERQLASAQRDAQQAQEDLQRAREDAARQLEDLAARQAGGRLDERQGLIDVFNATVENQATQTDPGATNLEREQAAIALERAQLALANTRRENARMAQERAKADRDGINGSDGVRAAQDRVTAALQAQKDAQDAVGDAAADARKVQVESAEAVSRALAEQRRTAADGARAIGEAQRAQGEAAADGARAIADAERARGDAAAASALAIEDARRAQLRTAEDGQRSVADARRGLTEAGTAAAEATQKVGEVGSASQRALDQAMDALGPAGQHFALFIFGLTATWHAFRDDIQSGLLPGVEDAITSLLDTYTPQLHGFLTLMGGVLGDVFRQIGDTLTNPAWQEFFSTLGKYLPIFTQQFATFGLNIGTAFANIFVALAPTSQDFGDWLVGLSEDFKNFTAGLRENPEFQQFLGYIREVGPEVWELTKNIFGAIKNIAEGLAPYGETILGIINGIAGFLANTDPEVAGGIALAFIALIGAFQLTSGLVALIGPAGLLPSFFGSLRPLGTAALWVARTAIPALAGSLGLATAPFLLIVAAAVAVGVGLYLLYQKCDWFRNAVDAVWRAVKAGAVWLWEKGIKPVFQAIADGFLWLYRKFRDTYNDYIKPIFELLGAIAAWVWNGKYGIKWALGKIADGFWWLYTKVRDTYNTYLKPIFDKLGDIIAKYIEPKFRAGVDLIKTAWDRLKDIAKAPIKFIVDTVLNNGLIAGFNKLADFFNTTPMKPIELGFAAGGRIPGWSPHSKADNVPIWATAGEFMQPVDSTQFYGVDAMEALRRKRVPRGALRAAAGLADGGMVGGIQALKTGGTVGAGSHPVGGMAALIAFGRFMRSLGFRAAEGPGEFGPVTGGHSRTSYHYRRPPQAIDFNWAPGTSKREQDAIDRMLVPRVKEYGLRLLWKIEDHWNHAHVDTGGWSGSHVGGGAEFGSGSASGWPSWLSGLDPVGWIKNKIGELTGVIKKEFTTDTPWFKMLTAIPSKLKDAVVNKITDFVGSFGDVASKVGEVFTGGKNAVGNIVQTAAKKYGWDNGPQWIALGRIIQKESAWNPNAQNPTSTAYGLFQFLNSTWAGVGMTKSSDPRVQAEAGVKYIKQAYGTPYDAWRFHQSHNWYGEGGEVVDNGTALYDSGGKLPPGLTNVLNASGKPEAILTNSEWRLLEDLARGNGTNGVPTTIDARSYGTQLTPADVADEILYAQRVMNRGGKYASAGVGMRVSAP